MEKHCENAMKVATMLEVHGARAAAKVSASERHYCMPGRSCPALTNAFASDGADVAYRVDSAAFVHHIIEFPCFRPDASPCLACILIGQPS